MLLKFIWYIFLIVRCGKGDDAKISEKLFMLNLCCVCDNESDNDEILNFKLI